MGPHLRGSRHCLVWLYFPGMLNRGIRLANCGRLLFACIELTCLSGGGSFTAWKPAATPASSAAPW